jgi:hypothetical protein
MSIPQKRGIIEALLFMLAVEVSWRATGFRHLFVVLATTGQFVSRYRQFTELGAHTPATTGSQAHPG